MERTPHRRSGAGYTDRGAGSSGEGQRECVGSGGGGVSAARALSGQIELRNVSLRYPARPEIEVLSSFNLTINAGETVALVGASGGGKSSVIKLILNLYEPCAGRVLLDGVDVHDFDAAWLAQQLSVVGQEPVLFARSVRENIAYGVATESGDFAEGAPADASIAVEKTLRGMARWASTKAEQSVRGESARDAAADLKSRLGGGALAESVRSAAVRANADCFIADLPKA